jgi:hypothetical protein
MWSGDGHLPTITPAGAKERAQRCGRRQRRHLTRCDDPANERAQRCGPAQHRRHVTPVTIPAWGERSDAGGFNVATSHLGRSRMGGERSDAGSDVTVPPVTVPKRSERSDAVSHRFTTLFV